MIAFALTAVLGQHLTVGSGGPDRVEYVHSPLRPAGGGVFSGVVPGIVMSLAAGGLLWWNEGRTVRREQLLASARCKAVPLGSESDIDAPPATLVHVAGLLQDGGPVSDAIF